LQVIWAIGVAMVILAGFIHFPVVVTGAVGVGIIALHNLLDPFVVQGGAPVGPGPSAAGAFWMVLHQPGFIRVFGAPMLVAYPLLPWIGVMLAGYALGSVYQWEPARRQRFLTRLGIAAIAAFVVIRATNLYGNPAPWAAQKSAVFTVLSFINTNKYPPSLLYVLMTIGPALLALAWLERVPRGAVGRFLLTYGRVPLFYYMLQWFFAHAIALGLSLAAGKSIAHLFGFPAFTQPAPGAGFGLGVTLLAWIAGVAMAYPLCRWFANLKRRRSDWWLSYM
ncbi:MAG TPA: heparan-alpha-glucosaminide N-acetyltransferase domain-containing protein, partial [Longimicrobium sp.]|nr:heparan-alpha-glucosaminide N-acetyltransferase domain-containing protein [Longimicrobium sp.]